MGRAVWAVQDLNLRPLACHAHISCSPALSDVQISPNGSTFCPPKFCGVCSYFLALLTALLTKCFSDLRRKSSTSLRESRLDRVSSATHVDN